MAALKRREGTVRPAGATTQRHRRGHTTRGRQPAQVTYGFTRLQGRGCGDKHGGHLEAMQLLPPAADPSAWGSLSPGWGPSVRGVSQPGVGLWGAQRSFPGPRPSPVPPPPASSRNAFRLDIGCFPSCTGPRPYLPLQAEQAGQSRRDFFWPQCYANQLLYLRNSPQGPTPPPLGMCGHAPRCPALSLGHGYPG